MDWSALSTLSRWSRYCLFASTLAILLFLSSCAEQFRSRNPYFYHVNILTGQTIVRGTTLPFQSRYKFGGTYLDLHRIFRIVLEDHGYRVTSSKDSTILYAECSVEFDKWKLKSKSAGDLRDDYLKCIDYGERLLQRKSALLEDSRSKKLFRVQIRFAQLNDQIQHSITLSAVVRQPDYGVSEEYPYMGRIDPWREINKQILSKVGAGDLSSSE